MPTLSFPQDRIVGHLYWAGSNSVSTGPVLATGIVEAPDDRQVRLILSELSGAERRPEGGWSLVSAHRPLDLRGIESLPWAAICTLAVREVVAESVSAIVGLAPGLTELLLFGSDLGDEAIPYIAQLTDLTSLQTFGNHFTDDGVQPLRALHRLESVALGETTLSAAALRFATMLPKLRQLGIWDIHVTPEEEQGLRAALPGVEISREGLTGGR
jgi:hypothetical protein